jgi:hypothetical protein
VTFTPLDDQLETSSRTLRIANVPTRPGARAASAVVVTIDGDRGVAGGETVAVNGVAASAADGNVFDSSLPSDLPRFPSVKNQLGWDVDILQFAGVPATEATLVPELASQEDLVGLVTFVLAFDL